MSDIKSKFRRRIDNGEIIGRGVFEEDLVELVF